MIPPQRDPRTAATAGAPRVPRAGREAESPTAPIRTRRFGASRQLIPGRTTDGRGWELITHERGVLVLRERATVAETHIWLLDDQITIEVWVDDVELPEGLARRLVRQSFGHPAVGGRTSVLVCIPRGNRMLLRQVLRTLDNPRTREAPGQARLIEGSIRKESVSVA